MLSTFVQGLVDQDSCPYYELSFTDFKITTVGQSGLRGAIEILRRVGILPPLPLDSPPTKTLFADPTILEQPLPEAPCIAMTESSQNVVSEAPYSIPATPALQPCDVPAAPPAVDIRSVDTNQVDQAAIVAEPSANQFQILASFIHSTLQQTEARIEARVDKLIVATQMDSNFTFSDAQKDFLEAGNYKQRNAKTHREYEFFFSFFVDVVGNKKLSDYRYSDANLYTEALSRLPRYPNKRKELDKCNYREMIEIGTRLNFQVIDKATQKRHIKTMKSFFHWCADKFNLRRDPSDGIRMDNYIRNEDQSRTSFLPEDLKKIFSHELVKKYKAPEEYWSPLIAFYSGMRVNEIAQLYVSNIIESAACDHETGAVKNVLCFQLVTDEDKRLKSRNSRRLVPIHSKLIELGFMRYLDDVKRRGFKHLFPGLTWGENGPGGEISAWFNNGYLRNKCDIGERTKTFHSFRNALQTSASHCSEIRSVAIDMICGYGRGTTVQRVHYISDAELYECHIALEKIRFPKLDLMPYKAHLFSDYLDATRSRVPPNELVHVIEKKKLGRPVGSKNAAKTCLAA